MTDQQEIILKLSKVIATQISIHKWITAGCAVMSFMLMNIVHHVSFLSYFFAGIFALSVLHFIYLHDHGHTMLSILKENNNTALSQLETYLKSQQQRWIKYYWWRVIFVAVFGLVMVFTLIFFQDSLWTQRIAGLFPAFIIALIVGGWSRFNDNILLHDVERSQQDHISEP